MEDYDLSVRHRCGSFSEPLRQIRRTEEEIRHGGCDPAVDCRHGFQDRAARHRRPEGPGRGGYLGLHRPAGQLFRGHPRLAEAPQRLGHRPEPHELQPGRGADHLRLCAAVHPGGRQRPDPDAGVLRVLRHDRGLEPQGGGEPVCGKGRQVDRGLGRL